MTAEVTLEKTYTIEEFIVLPENGKDYELVEGKLVEMAGANEEHCRICSILHTYLGPYVRQNKLGMVYGADMRYTTVAGDPATVRQAAVSFMQKSRVVKGVFTAPYAPDLAVEVISESNTFSAIEKKVREYQQAGSKLVWVIEPELQTVYIYRADSNQRLSISGDEELSGEDVVPGFTLKVNTLFEDE